MKESSTHSSIILLLKSIHLHGYMFLGWMSVSSSQSGWAEFALRVCSKKLLKNFFYKHLDFAGLVRKSQKSSFACELSDISTLALARNTVRTPFHLVFELLCLCSWLQTKGNKHN